LSAGEAEPEARYYDSQGLRLHYADWGNEAAPPLVLLHGGRDHCRSWDAIARALRPHFHVMAADLRGHGDSDWAKGSSYSLADHVYDLTRMAGAAGFDEAALVGHSFGGMVSLTYAGAFPERVTRLAILDGAFLRQQTRTIDQQFARWTAELDRVAAARPRRYATIEEAAARMRERNRRLTPELGLHLARHALKTNADGTFAWKFDPAQRVSAPYRLTTEDTTTLWSRITCPVRLYAAGEGFMPDPKAAGILKYFGNADQRIIEGAGHWLHHDKLDQIVSELKTFFGVS
jgi:pimeloyl-ACP methyl ester carboxylesterase